MVVRVPAASHRTAWEKTTREQLVSILLPQHTSKQKEAPQLARLLRVQTTQLQKQLFQKPVQVQNSFVKERIQAIDATLSHLTSSSRGFSLQESQQQPQHLKIHAQLRVVALLRGLTDSRRVDLIQQVFVKYALLHQSGDRALIHDAAIEAFCKTDALDRAMQVFEAIGKQQLSFNKATFRPFIMYYWRKNDAKGVVDAIEDMLKSGVIPSQKTLNIALQNCWAVPELRPKISYFFELLDKHYYGPNGETMVMLARVATSYADIQWLLEQARNWSPSVFNQSTYLEITRASIRLGDIQKAFIYSYHGWKIRKRRNIAEVPKAVNSLLLRASLNAELPMAAIRQIRNITGARYATLPWSMVKAQFQIAATLSKTHPATRQALFIWRKVRTHENRKFPDLIRRQMILALGASGEKSVLQYVLDELCGRPSNPAWRWLVFREKTSSFPPYLLLNDQTMSERTASVFFNAFALVNDHTSMSIFLKSSFLPPISQRLFKWCISLATSPKDFLWLPQLLLLTVQSKDFNKELVRTELLICVERMRKSQQRPLVNGLSANWLQFVSNMGHVDSNAMSTAAVNALIRYMVESQAAIQSKTDVVAAINLLNDMGKKKTL